MNEEDRDQHYAEDLVNRYEQMLSNNESYYFDIDQFEDIVEYYLEENKFPMALKAIAYAYTLFPENTSMMLKEAQILSSMGRLTNALNVLKNLEKFSPKNEELLITMGSVYSQLREHQKAITYFKSALDVAGPDYKDDIYLEIALEYENMDRYDKAIEVLREAIEYQPDNEVFLYELAFCFEVGERYAECIEYYNAFLERHPYSFPAWYNLGNAYQKMEQMEDALEAYDYAIAIQADFAPAYYNKAHALFKLERYQQAIQILEDSYSVEQPQAPVYCHVGECFEKLNELDKALFYYRKSLLVDENYGDAYLGIGIVLDLQGKTDESLAFIEKAMELEPENVDYQLFMVEMLKKLDRYAEAEAITEVLIQRFTDNEDVWLDHSDNFFKRGDFAEALRVINEGWQKNPQSTALGFRKVVYLMESGQTIEAQDLLLRMMLNDSDGSEELEEYYPEIKNNLLYIDLKKQLKGQ